MKSIKYNLLNTNENTYFLGAKYADGYRLGNREELNELNFSKIFYIKGGPGTGKSTFMRKISYDGVSHGFAVTVYLCGSDSDSVDGIILSNGNLKYGFFDATAPHVMDTEYPGVISTIINTSDFRDDSALTADRTEIIKLYNDASVSNAKVSELKKEIIQINRLFVPYVRNNTFSDKVAEIIVNRIGNIENTNGVPNITYTHSFSQKGRICLDTFYKKADCIICIGDNVCSYYILNRISEYLKSRKIESDLCVSPLDPSCVNDIYINEGKLLISGTFTEKDLIRYNTKITKIYDTDFQKDSDKNNVKMLNIYKKLKCDTENHLLNEIKNSFNIHKKIESFYTQATDFSTFDRFTEGFTYRLFDM